MQIDYYKIISGDGGDIIFLPNSFRVFNIVDKERYNLDLKGLLNEEIAIENSYMARLNEYFTKQRSALTRLVLGVSNLCNFKCVYCYAEQGNYGGKETIIESNTAKEIIDKLFRVFSKIEFLQFFGGEPCLAFDKIIEICDYVSNLYKIGSIKELPKFGITTNGSILNDAILKILKKYNISLTVSIDGNQNIHDKLRKLKNGAKTSVIVEQNICKLKEQNIKIDIESTFTNYHIKENISIFDTLVYFYNKLGVVSIHIPPVSASSRRDSEWNIFPQSTKICIQNYRDAVRKCLKTWVETNQPLTFSFLDRYIYSLLNNKKMPLLCPAYFDTLAIWYNGDIYPCFMFWGKENFKIGNVFTIQPENLLYNQQNNLYYKWNFKDCRTCWARWICHTCAGGILLNQDRLEFLDEDLCNLNKNIIEEIIINLAKIRTNDSDWNKLIQNLTKIRRINKINNNNI